MKRFHLILFCFFCVIQFQASPAPWEREIVASTYLGGKGGESCRALLLEGEGSILISGSTSSPGFPVTEGVVSRKIRGGEDIFLTRLDKDLTRLVASTLLGGSGSDRCMALAVDGEGHIVMAGNTGSPDFPVTEGAYSGSPRGKGDLFVLKIDPSMKRIVASTVLGGRGFDSCQGMALDESGSIYLSGMTDSPDFPITPKVFDTSYNTGGFKGDYRGNIFILKLDSDLSTLMASTYLGGKGGEVMGHLALDRKGNVFVTGSTRSLDFPITEDAFDLTFNGDPNFIAGDVFITKLAPDLDKVLASTYLGGPGFDWGYHVALDGKDHVYVTGHVGRDFPVTSKTYDPSYNDAASRGFGSDAYVIKMDSSLTRLLASTYLGGPGEDIGTVLLTDRFGNVHVAGVTREAGFPTQPGAIQSQFNPGNGQYQGDLFLSQLTTDLDQLAASTLYGGSGNEQSARCIALGEKGCMVVGGSTSSSDLKMPESAYDQTFNGGSDIFVLKMDDWLY